jgi:hypothetical protein
MKKLPWFDRQSRTGERPEPDGDAPTARSKTGGKTNAGDIKRPLPPPAPPVASKDFELKMWNVPAIQTAAPEMYRVLENNLKDMDMIDRVCDSAGFPRFEIMRKEIEDVLEKARRS